MGRVFPNRAAYNRGSYGRPPPRLLTAFYARTPLQSLYNNSSMGKKHAEYMAAGPRLVPPWRRWKPARRPVSRRVSGGIGGAFGDVVRVPLDGVG